MTIARPRLWRRRAGWSVLWIAAVMVQAWVWVAVRPKVRATSDDGMGAYAKRSHLQVFGADITFMLITGAVALLAVVVTVALRRGRPLLPSQILLGAAASMMTSVAVMRVAPLLDSVSRGTGQPFPPARLPAGASVIEPVRLHAYGSLLAGAVCWLGALMLAAAVRPREPR